MHHLRPERSYFRIFLNLHTEHKNEEMARSQPWKLCTCSLPFLPLHEGKTNSRPISSAQALLSAKISAGLRGGMQTANIHLIGVDIYNDCGLANSSAVNHCLIGGLNSCGMMEHQHFRFKESSHSVICLIKKV